MPVLDIGGTKLQYQKWSQLGERAEAAISQLDKELDGLQETRRQLLARRKALEEFLGDEPKKEKTQPPKAPVSV